MYGTVLRMCRHLCSAASAAFPRILNVGGHASASKIKVNPKLVKFRRAGQLGALDMGIGVKHHTHTCTHTLIAINKSKLAT